MIPSDGSPEKAGPPPAAAPSLEVERAVALLTRHVDDLERTYVRGCCEACDRGRDVAKLLRALAARLSALEAENRQLATDLAAAHAAVDRGVAQLLTLHEDAALLRAERDDALAKLSGFTAEDVELCRGIAEYLLVGSYRRLDAIGIRSFNGQPHDALQRLADRVHALLPPPSSKRDDR